VGGGSGAIQEGLASYYADRFEGRTTASGEIFSQSKLTAAHKTLKFGTMVRVTRVDDGRSVVVRVNDRGPFVEGRIIDLSRRAAEQLGMIAAGVVRVRVSVVSGDPDF
jgi:rare lipoprotein A